MQSTPSRFPFGVARYAYNFFPNLHTAMALFFGKMHKHFLERSRKMHKSIFEKKCLPNPPPGKPPNFKSSLEIRERVFYLVSDRH